MFSKYTQSTNMSYLHTKDSARINLDGLSYRLVGYILSQSEELLETYYIKQ